MFCPECGKEILKDSLYCSECGKKIIKLDNTILKKRPQKNELNVSKNISSPSVNTNSYYVGIIICTITILISALLLPVYYYEGRNIELSITFLGHEEISSFFGLVYERPIIRCNTIVFICLVLTSIIIAALACIKKNKYITSCFVVALCAMIVHPICLYNNLPEMYTVRSVSVGFFVIVIAIIVGMIFSYKCNQGLISKESEKKQ